MKYFGASRSCLQCGLSIVADWSKAKIERGSGVPCVFALLAFLMCISVTLLFGLIPDVVRVKPPTICREKPCPKLGKARV